MRAGRLIQQIEGYRAFIPAPLPPSPPPVFDSEMICLLSQADRALGRLDGITSILPNPDLFVAMFVRQEAVLSSQIEGTQSTLDDVLQFELNEEGVDLPKDVGEVVNYVNAMNYGLERLKDLPLCLNLIKEIHDRLLRGVRGGEKTPGDFRRTQNWIGPSGCTLNAANFVPPPVHEMHPALDNLERFFHDADSFPVLVHCALAHAQFETIHPFIDGNGRVGRLLITFWLCQREILHRPLLYLSSYLKAHRAEYYDRLMAIRLSGDWEGWIKFFLRGVFQVSQAASDTARKILELRERYRRRSKSSPSSITCSSNRSFPSRWSRGDSAASSPPPPSTSNSSPKRASSVRPRASRGIAAIGSIPISPSSNHPTSPRSPGTTTPDRTNNDLTNQEIPRSAIAMSITFYDQHGIRFEYPGEWELEVTDDGPLSTVAVQQPGGLAFALVTVDESCPAPAEVADQALEALREEYPILDAFPALETIAGHPAVGHDIEFISLDMTNSCTIRCFRTPRRTILLFGQWSDLVGEESEATLDSVRRTFEETDTADVD